MCLADTRVLALVRDIERAGATAMMVTAAPAEYANALSEAFGFSECLATLHGRHPAWEENARHIKCKRVMEALEEGRVSRPLSLFTDHLDDLPLMAVADSVFLVGSIARERAALAKRLGAAVSVQTLGED
jgi:phosphoserine phosphatase